MARRITDIVNEGEALGVVGGEVASIAVGGGGGGSSTLYYSRPTHAVTRASDALGSFSVPWTDSVVTPGSSQAIRYDVDVSMQASGANLLGAGLKVGSTLIDWAQGFLNSDNRETRIKFSGVYVAATAGTYTFEVLGSCSGGGTATVSATQDTSTAYDATKNGVSSMTLQLVTIA